MCSILMNFAHLGAPSKSLKEINENPDTKKNEKTSCELLDRDFQDSQVIQPIAVALGYFSEVKGKSLLLKTPFTSEKRLRDP